MSETQTKTKAKGTKVTESIIGASAVKLQAAVKNIAEAATQATKLESILTDYTVKVTDYEDKITNLSTEYTQKKSEQDFKLQLEFKTDREKFAKTWMDENGLVSIHASELQELRESHDTLRRDFDSKVQAEVGKATGIAKSSLESER
jgi:hypothetical protein